MSIARWLRKIHGSRRADGGISPSYQPSEDTVMVVLSTGALSPACCPELVIVDHDGRGLLALLLEHRRDAHGRGR